MREREEEEAREEMEEEEEEEVIVAMPFLVPCHFSAHRVEAISEFLLSHHPSVEKGTNFPCERKLSSSSFELINVEGNFKEVYTV